jgi:hypothetical protein
VRRICGGAFDAAMNCCGESIAPIQRDGDSYHSHLAPPVSVGTAARGMAMSRESERERNGRRNVVRGRLEIVAAALELPASEVEKILKYGDARSGPLLDFAKRYNQDLDWLLAGDVGSMCRTLALNGGWRPKWWSREFDKAQEN